MRSARVHHKQVPSFSVRARGTVLKTCPTAIEEGRWRELSLEMNGYQHMDHQAPPLPGQEQKNRKSGACRSDISLEKQRTRRPKTLRTVGRNLRKVFLYHMRTISPLLTSYLGTYTYPISFPIPGNAPPTMQCDYGSVVWRLRATAHRPGTFKSKLTASREVIMIACPLEEDTEDTENIVVERHWDQQLQYLISISGRSFYIGGTVPVTFTLMPLAKVKIHRVSVFIEGVRFLSVWLYNTFTQLFCIFRKSRLLYQHETRCAF